MKCCHAPATTAPPVGTPGPPQRRRRACTGPGKGAARRLAHHSKNRGAELECYPAGLELKVTAAVVAPV